MTGALPPLGEPPLAACPHTSLAGVHVRRENRPAMESKKPITAWQVALVVSSAVLVGAWSCLCLYMYLSTLNPSFPHEWPVWFGDLVILLFLAAPFMVLTVPTMAGLVIGLLTSGMKLGARSSLVAAAVIINLAVALLWTSGLTNIMTLLFTR